DYQGGTVSPLHILGSHGRRPYAEDVEDAVAVEVLVLLNAGARSQRPVGAFPIAEQNGDVVGALVGDRQIEQAVAVEILGSQVGGVGPGEESAGGPKLAFADPQVDEHVVRPAVGDDQVRQAIGVEVGGTDGTGSQDPVAAIL